jgi:hypothetical protein
MIEVHDQTLSEPVEVDDTHFLNCHFESVQLRYAGGIQPRFENCTFNEVGWYFTGAALRTIQLLQVQNQDGHAQAMIDDLFRPGNILSE